MAGKHADARVVAKKDKGEGKAKGKREKVLGPATVVKPALFGAAGLLVIQGAMKMFLHA